MWAINNARQNGLDISFKLVYTGRSDDPTLEQTLFADLQISQPDVYLGVDCDSLNELTGRVMAEFERYLAANKTDVVIVVDDLASTMAVAIVTKKCGVRLAHLVAGTRSFDINMPKEINRLVIDGLSDYLFTAGAGSSSIVTREGAAMSQIYMVGNILMDTLRFNHSRLRWPAVIDSLGISEGRYLLFTLNRKALLSDEGKLKRMLVAMVDAAGEVPVVAPLRKPASDVVAGLPATRWASLTPHFFKPASDVVAGFGLPSGSFFAIEPLPYLEFGYLSAHAMGIVTDSGNVAEEATFNNIPCATLNSYTEHIETVSQGSNVLVGEDAARLGQAVGEMVAGKWKKCSLPDRWDGRTAERIVRILAEMK